MNIVVLVKQAPNTTEVRIDPKTGNLIREGVESSDTWATSTALGLAIKWIRSLLKPATRGEKVASFALTEADAPTDLGRIKTTAKRDGDHWVINGSKTWMTNAPVADFFTVLCHAVRQEDRQLPTGAAENCQHGYRYLGIPIDGVQGRRIDRRWAKTFERSIYGEALRLGSSVQDFR